MRHSKTKVQAFRASYARATAAGYCGTKMEWARLLDGAPHLFASDLVEAAEAWLDYMDKSERRRRLTKEVPYINNDGAAFRSWGRVR